MTVLMQKMPLLLVVSLDSMDTLSLALTEWKVLGMYYFCEVHLCNCMVCEIVLFFDYSQNLLHVFSKMNITLLPL